MPSAFRFVRSRFPELLLAALLALSCAALAQEGEAQEETAQEEAAPAAEALYTQEQAERGGELYGENCQECHAADLSGIDPFPALRGSSFFSNWEDSTVGELLEYVEQNMPLSAAGSLEPQTYADIMAHLLMRWGYPAGETELPADPAEVLEAPVEPQGEDGGEGGDGG